MAKNFHYYMEKVSQIYFEESETLEKNLEKIKKFLSGINTEYYNSIIDSIDSYLENPNNDQEKKNLNQSLLNILNHKDTSKIKQYIETCIDQIIFDYMLELKELAIKHERKDILNILKKYDNVTRDSSKFEKFCNELNAIKLSRKEDEIEEIRFEICSRNTTGDWS